MQVDKPPLYAETIVVPSIIKRETDHRRLIEPTLKRYIILFLFCVNSGNKAFQWIHIPASTNKVTIFYDVSNFVINTTSVIFMLSFVVLSLPACYIIEIIGLRKAVIFGSAGTALGSIVKCFCCRQSSLDIYLLFAGQIIVSLSEQFIFSVPNRLASVWFPDNQVSTAVAMTVLGNSLGIALGFLVPQMMLGNANTKDQIGSQLYNLYLVLSIISVVFLVADYIFFDEAPEFAPGEARLKQIQSESEAKQVETNLMLEMRKLLKQVRDLFKDKSYSFLAVAYGINIGMGYAIQTILNQMLEPLWPGDDVLVGKCGFIIIITGSIAVAVFGHILDKTHKYKLVNILLTVAVVLSLIFFGFAISITHSRTATYIGSGLLGISLTGLIATGLELAVEITYPAPELITSSMMNVPPQVFGAIFVYICSYIIDNHGAIMTIIFIILCHLIALASLFATKETLKRQQAVMTEKHVSTDRLHLTKVGLNFIKDRDPF